MTNPRTLTAILGSLLALGLTTPVTAANADDVAGSSHYVIDGHGFGHGHGMSQYGARAAAHSGRSWRQIVGLYYPGTSIGTTSGRIRVLITAATRPTLTVESRPGLRVHRVGGSAHWRLDHLEPKAQSWRIQPHANRSILWVRTAHHWRRAKSITGQVEFSAGGAPVTLRLPRQHKASYRGALRTTGGQTVNVLPLDQYLRGVVSQEMPSYWPSQALRAQAVAARSYAAYERDHTLNPDYDICDAESCQVYGGAAAEVASTDRAIRATRNKAVLYQGAPAYTQFSASNGGQSSAGSMPYLVAQVDPFETAHPNPNTNWGPIPFTEAELEEAWPRVGTILTMSFTRDGTGDYGGWVTSVTITGSAETVVLSGEDFAFTLNLRSPYLRVQAVVSTRPATHSST